MFSPAPERGPLSRGERWTFAIILFAVLGLFAAEIATDYTPAKLGGVLVILFWIPLLVTHEAGHAFVAKILGWHLGKIVLGFGRPWARLRSGNAVVEIRSFPITGCVVCVPTHLRQPRLRNALVYFAGPGVDLLIAAVVIVAVGPDLLLEPTSRYGMVALQALTVAALAQGLLNLLPLAFTHNGRVLASDGLGIILSFRLPESYFRERIESFRELGAAYFEDEAEPRPVQWWKEDRRL